MSAIAAVREALKREVEGAAPRGRLDDNWRPLGEIATAVAAKASMRGAEPQPEKEVAKPAPQGA